MKPAIALLLLAGAACAQPDFSGVWKLAADQHSLTTIAGQAPPLLPAAAQAWQVTKAKRAAGDLSWDGVATKCKPPGEPRVLLESMPFEIVQQKDKLFFSYQWNRLDRFVYLDRPLKVNATTYLSTSEGTWNADTLVIDSEGYNGKTTLDADGLPQSGQTKLTERLSLSPDGNTLTERITVNDPVNYSAPWDTELKFARQSGHIEEDICEIREGLFKE